MAEEIREVREATAVDNNGYRTVREVNDPLARRDYRQTVAARVVWFVAGVLLTILGLRFLFALLGANPNNGFANFIYSVSHPFVAPFFNLFGYNFTVGSQRFEFYTLVAMAIYALIAYGIAKLITITRR